MQEEEIIVLPDVEFEELWRRRGLAPELRADSIMEYKAGVFWLFIRQSEWDQRQARGACRERISAARGGVKVDLPSIDAPNDKITIQQRREEWLIRKGGTVHELGAYAAAEEQIVLAQAVRGDIIKAAGIRAELWDEGDEGCLSYQRAFSIVECCDIFGYGAAEGVIVAIGEDAYESNWRNRLITRSEEKAAYVLFEAKVVRLIESMCENPSEYWRFIDLGTQIYSARKTQHEVFRMAGARWAEYHPREEWQRRHPEEPLSNYNPDEAEE